MTSHPSVITLAAEEVALARAWGAPALAHRCGARLLEERALPKLVRQARIRVALALDTAST